MFLTLKFYQMPYVYGLITIAEFLIAWVYCKVTQTRVNIMEDVLPIVCSPALHMTGNRMVRQIKGKTFRKTFSILLKWDGTLNLICLHLANLILIYIPFQYLNVLLAPGTQNVKEEYLTYALIGYVLAIIPVVILRSAFYLFGRRWRLIERSAEEVNSDEKIEMVTDKNTITSAENPNYEKYVNAYSLND
jgi:hypothetical protein